MRYIHHFLTKAINWRFLRNPSELKSIKNISLLRQQMSGSDQQQSQQQQQQQQQPQQQQQQVVVKSEPGDSAEDDLRPTDLSIPQHFRVTADFEWVFHLFGHNQLFPIIFIVVYKEDYIKNRTVSLSFVVHTYSLQIWIRIHR